MTHVKVQLTRDGSQQMDSHDDRLVGEKCRSNECLQADDNLPRPAASFSPHCIAKLVTLSRIHKQNLTPRCHVAPSARRTQPDKLLLLRQHPKLAVRSPACTCLFMPGFSNRMSGPKAQGRWNGARPRWRAPQRYPPSRIKSQTFLAESSTPAAATLPICNCRGFPGAPACRDHPIGATPQRFVRENAGVGRRGGLHAGVSTFSRRCHQRYRRNGDASPRPLGDLGERGCRPPLMRLWAQGIGDGVPFSRVTKLPLQAYHQVLAVQFFMGESIIASPKDLKVFSDQYRVAMIIWVSDQTSRKSLAPAEGAPSPTSRRCLTVFFAPTALVFSQL